MSEQYPSPLDLGRKKLFEAASERFDAPDFDVPDKDGKQISKILLFDFAGDATAIIGKKAESDPTVTIPGNENHEVYELSIYDGIIELVPGETFGDEKKLIIELYFTDLDHQVLDGRDLPPEFFDVVANSLIGQDPN
jgi:hypothetical protein